LFIKLRNTPYTNHSDRIEIDHSPTEQQHRINPTSTDYQTSSHQNVPRQTPRQSRHHHRRRFGKGIAAEFKKQGAEVIIADFAEDVGQKTAGELKCEFQKSDVTKKSDWEALVKFADEKFGRLDVVVNNAGTTYRNKV
jgi:hypothetical protein